MQETLVCKSTTAMLRAAHSVRRPSPAHLCAARMGRHNYAAYRSPNRGWATSASGLPDISTNGTAAEARRDAPPPPPPPPKPMIERALDLLTDSGELAKLKAAGEHSTAYSAARMR
jgi:hypothetical protein